MTDIGDLPVDTGQAYPQQHPWFDLSPFFVNSWRNRLPRSSWFQLAGNKVEVTSHVFIGDDVVIATGLPVFASAHQQLMGVTPSGVVCFVEWRSGGEIRVTSNWGAVRDGGRMLITGKVARV